MNNLSIIVRLMRTFAERRMQKFSIGFPEQIILMYLSTHKDVIQDDVAQYFSIDKGAVAKTIKKLEEKKLIVRTENPNNKREKILSLCDSSQGIYENMERVLSDWKAAVYKGISNEDQEKFNSITEKMAQNAIQLLQETKE